MTWKALGSDIDQPKRWGVASDSVMCLPSPQNGAGAGRPWHSDCLVLLSFFKNNFCLFIYLFWTVLGPCCCAQALSSRSKQGLSALWRAGVSLQSIGSRRAGFVAAGRGLGCSAACGIFPDQEQKPRPLHWQADSHHSTNREVLSKSS